MELQPEEIKGAEEEIVRFAQRQAFRDGYAALSSGKPIPKKSQLITLNPCSTMMELFGVMAGVMILDFQSFCLVDTG